MNIKTNLLEDYVNLVDATKKQKEYSKLFLFSIAIITSFFNFIFYLKI